MPGSIGAAKSKSRERMAAPASYSSSSSIYDIWHIASRALDQELKIKEKENKRKKEPKEKKGVASFIFFLHFFYSAF